MTKKHKSIKFVGLMMALSSLLSCSSGLGSENGSMPYITVLKSNSETSIIEYDGIETPSNYDNFINEIRIGSTNNNNAGSCGIVYSPYYTVQVQNEQEITAYSANVVQGLSSFAYVKKGEGSITVNVKFYQTINTVKFYCIGDQPVYQKTSSNVIQLTLTEHKSYTICINNDLYKCLTLFVEREVNFERGNSNVIIYKPGVHDYTIEAEVGEALYFAKGIHYVRNIVLNSDTQLYFEDGAFIKSINPSKDKETPVQDPDWNGNINFTNFIKAYRAKNIKIYGHGIIDFSKLDFHARGGLKFQEVNNIAISDIMFNNPAEWTMDMACCQNLNLQNIKIFGYRQNSDGICIEDCQNSLVENCFARTGDDVFEVKSRYGNSKIEIKNIRFNNCVSWPEKARGLGIISETSRDITDAKWENCIVISYIPKWMQKLGACVVIGEGKGKITNITFDNIKIYNNIYYPINVTLGSNSTNIVDTIKFKNIYYENEYNLCIQNDSETGEIDNIYFENITSSTYNLIDKPSTIIKNGDIGNVYIN